ncbi:MAG TPA: M20/M25/M40 family metallo-hydrolase, partial [Flavobacteriaceae bacterium]|nr:M20/M25/M40 family metallo-hydrolase [Flavobacteriaceae bacterium]
QAVLDLKETWETMIADAGRTDITVRIYNHNNTTMPSLILTIEGAETPDEFVITGGHIDSTSFQGNGNAPGADDNASGIATLTEALRVLLELEYVPQKTIEIMAYAAEEIGLVGSAEIAEEYANNNVNVISYVQFDMTGYQGSASDIYIATDDYNSENLNSFLIELIQFYNSSGSHQLSYGLTVCNYGCSDHYSWAQNGYEAAFPFEAAFGQHNPNIHMASDTYSFLGNADHAAKFTKLALQYLIETAKVHQAASVDDLNQNRLRVFTQNNRLYYETLSGDSLENLALYDLSGKLLMLEINPASSGEISLESLASGVYMCSFEVSGKGIYIKKILVH